MRSAVATSRRLPIVAVALAIAASPQLARAATRDLSVYYGTARATLGSWFGTLAIGDVDTAAPRATPDVKIAVVTTGRRLDGVDLTFPAESCGELATQLARRWGKPTADGWLAKSGGQGASLETSVDLDLSCRLRFFRRVSPERWLNGSRDSVVPIWAIGKPASELETAIAALQPQRDDQELRWEDSGIDGTRVSLSATLRGTRIATIRVSTDVDSHSTPVWSRLRAMFGAPDSAITDEDTYRWRWRRAPRIEVGTFVGDWPVMLHGAPRSTRTPSAPDDPGFPLSIVFGAYAR